MNDGPARPSSPLSAVHRALADPLRIRLLEALWVEPRSVRELAARVDMPADRLYHHVGQLERAGLIEISEYRPLPGGKVERVYAWTRVEPPGDDSSPAELATFLGAVLEVTRADIMAASLAREQGERREVSLGRFGVHLNREHLEELRTAVEKLITDAAARPDDDGVWTTVLWTAVDREPRPDGESRER